MLLSSFIKQSESGRVERWAASALVHELAGPALVNETTSVGLANPPAAIWSASSKPGSDFNALPGARNAWSHLREVLRLDRIDASLTRRLTATWLMPGSTSEMDQLWLWS
jgi:hypothetical protein